YKNIAKSFLRLITKRKEALATAVELPPRKFMEEFLYPLIGVYAVILFIGKYFDLNEFNVQEMLRHTLAQITSLILSFYLIAVALCSLSKKYLDTDIPLQKMQIFIGYILSVDIVVNIILEFSLPQIFYALSLYMIVLLWEGPGIFLNLKDEKKITIGIATIAVFYVLKTVITSIINRLIL
ncbi:MAG: YIP1 family protein, partial [Bacteroidales bacterium]